MKLFIIKIMDKYQSAGTYIYCKNPKGQWFLLCAKRAGHNPRFQGGKYNVPVGMKDSPMEPAAKCAQREVQEETGLNIPIDKFRLVGEEEWAPHRIGANFMVILDGTLGDYQIGEGDWENKKYKWLPVAYIPNLKWAYNIQQSAQDINNKFNIHENKMKRKIKITEAQLRNHIKKAIRESVKRTLSENEENDNRYWYNDSKAIANVIGKTNEARTVFYEEVYKNLLKMSKDEHNHKLIDRYSTALDNIVQLGDYLMSSLKSEWSKNFWMEEPEFN